MPFLLPWLAGCVLAYQPAIHTFALPENFWTTTPQGCPYQEIAVLEAEGWTVNEATDRLREWITDKGKGEAIIHFKLSRRSMPLPSMQCAQVPGCALGNATLWTASGVFVLLQCEEL